MLGRAVDLQALDYPPGFLRHEGLVQARRRVGVQLVHHQHDLVRLPVASVDQIPHDLGEVLAGPALGDVDLAPPGHGFEGYEETGHPIADVHAVVALHLARRHRQRFPHLADQWGEGLVQTNHRAVGLVRTLIHLQNIFHIHYELGRGLRWDDPHLQKRQFEFVFLSTRRTVSYDTVSA